VIWLVTVLVAHLMREKWYLKALRRKQNDLSCFKRTTKTKVWKLFQMLVLT